MHRPMLCRLWKGLRQSWLGETPGTSEIYWRWLAWSTADGEALYEAKGKSKGERQLNKCSGDWSWHRTRVLDFSCTFQILRRHAKSCSKRFERNYLCGRLFIKIVRYADDQLTIASSVEGIQHMMDKMQETAVEYGMNINKISQGWWKSARE